MITKIDNSSAGHDRSSVELALAVLMERISGLPKEDKNDLYELSKALLEADSPEEAQDARRAMQEILEQAPMKARELVIPEGDGGLEKWTAYVSQKIVALRMKAGMTQQQLAERSGLTQSHVSRLESGKHSPNNATLVKLADALGVPVGEIDPSCE